MSWTLTKKTQQIRLCHSSYEPVDTGSLMNGVYKSTKQQQTKTKYSNFTFSCDPVPNNKATAQTISLRMTSEWRLSKINNTTDQLCKELEK